MRLENIKYDFPKMPEEMRSMIEREVEKQVKTEQPRFGRNKRTAGRTIAASLAAVLLCGTTVFAGVGIYTMQQEKVGKHGVNVKIEKDETQEQVDDSYENALQKGGVSMTFFRMDTGDDKFSLQHEDVLLSEEFSAGGHEGVYLEYPKLSEDEITFNQRIYLAFT